MAIVSNRDKAEFAAYLRACTDAQVLGVIEKEQKARRQQYAALAVKEAWMRGLDPHGSVTLARRA